MLIITFLFLHFISNSLRIKLGLNLMEIVCLAAFNHMGHILISLINYCVDVDWFFILFWRSDDWTMIVARMAWQIGATVIKDPLSIFYLFSSIFIWFEKGVVDLVFELIDHIGRIRTISTRLQHLSNHYQNTSVKNEIVLLFQLIPAHNITQLKARPCLCKHQAPNCTAKYIA